MHAVLGAIIGDIAGSRFEFSNTFDKNFKMLDKDCYFTDDTVLTLAIAISIINNIDYATSLRRICKNYIHSRSFGARFVNFVNTGIPNDSYGNGSAIRVAYIGEHFNSLNNVLKEAEKSAIASHTHTDAIAGAKCIAGCIHLAKNNATKNELRKFYEKYYDTSLESIKPSKVFNVSCSGSIPVAIKSVLETDNFEDCIKTSITYGGDSDSIACMAGSIAGMIYKDSVIGYEKQTLEFLDNNLKEIYFNID